MHRQTSMHRVVYILTFTALSVHILFGCCLHHAHTFDAAHESQGLVTAVSCTCSAHGHGEKEGPDKQDGHEQDGHHDRDSHHRHCDGGTCVFMRADSVDAPDLSIGQNSLATASVSACPASTSCFQRADARLEWVGAAIPIHLANQAFLL